VADQMELERIGPQHQAGSDSLLTGHAFFKMKEMFFEDKIDDSKYCGHLYGLGVGYSQNGALCAVENDKGVIANGNAVNAPLPSAAATSSSTKSHSSHSESSSSQSESSSTSSHDGKELAAGDEELLLSEGSSLRPSLLDGEVVSATSAETATTTTDSVVGGAAGSGSGGESLSDATETLHESTENLSS